MPTTTVNLGRGAIPTPAHELAAAATYVPTTAAPPTFIRIPQHFSSWGNVSLSADQTAYAICVTAEEAFAKTCNNPEILISDEYVIAWAAAHNTLNGASPGGVIQTMQSDGFLNVENRYDDGDRLAVYNIVDPKLPIDPGKLRSAISEGPVKTGIAANQLNNVVNNWVGNNNYVPSGWFAVNFVADTKYDHCVSLCGYGSLDWLTQQLNMQMNLSLQVPAGMGTAQGYAMFTWGSIGIIDEPSLLAITNEAWSRTPTTKTT